MKVLFLLITMIYICDVNADFISFTPHVIEKYSIDINEFEILDFDGDGDDDIVTNVVNDYGSGNEIKWYENINDSFTAKYISIELADLNLAQVVYSSINSTGLYDIYIMKINSLYPYRVNEIYKLTQISTLSFQTQLFMTNDINVNHKYMIANLNNDVYADVVEFEEIDYDTYKVVIHVNNNGILIRNDLGITHKIFGGTAEGNAFNTDALSTLYIEDINSDGNNDIIYLITDLVAPLTYDVFITYLKNNGNGSFINHTIGPSGVGLQSFNSLEIRKLIKFFDEGNNGLIDILYSQVFNPITPYFSQVSEDNFVPNSINLTNQTFNGHVLFNNQDNDGDIDIFLVPYFSPSFIEYHENDGMGNYSRIQLVDTSSDVTDAALLDLGNDGLEDIITLESQNFHKYFQSSSLVFEKKQLTDELFGFPKIVKSVNFNNDSNLDVLAVSDSNSSLFLYINQGNNLFNKIMFDEQDDDVIGIGMLDYNEDGLQDILTVTRKNSSEIDLFWYENQNNQNFIKHFVITIQTFNNTKPTSRFDFIDLDNDGDLDLLQRNKEARVFWFENIQNTFQPYNIIINDFGNDYYDINFIDYDGDGDIDVTLSFKQSSFIGIVKSTYWMELNSAKEYVKHEIEPNLFYKIFKPGDINGDGMIDFLVKDENNFPYVLKHTASGFDQISLVNVNLSDSLDVSLNDINNDSKVDIILNNKAYISTGNSFNFLKTNFNHLLGNNQQRIFLDFDGDEKIEVLTFKQGIKLLDVTINENIFNNGFE